MASIQTGIELNDQFTGVIYRIIDAVNLTVSAMEDMQHTMNTEMDTSSIEGVRDEINQATMAMNELNTAMQGQTTPNITPPVEVPVQWVSDNIEVFQTTGIERFQNEIESTNTMLSGLNDVQAEITRNAQNMNILPQDAVSDIQNLESRIQELQTSIEQAEQSSLDIGSEEANTQLEQLRMQLSQLSDLQSNLNAAMQGMDIEDINNAYLQLSRNVSNVERNVRDNFSSSVEIPVTWRTESLDVFTSTGIERFQQEVQSTNDMLNTLNQTQTRIEQTASAMNILPDGAMQEINAVGQRIQAVQSRIQQIENNPLNMGTATANAELERLRSQLNQMIQQQNELNQAMQGMDISAANNAYLRLSQTVANTERYIRDNVDAQGRFNQAINEGVANTNSLMNTIKGAVAAYATIQTAGKVLDLSDTLTSTIARLNLMNDNLQSTQDLQNMIYLSAQRSRGAYQSTADAVAKLGLMAGDAFGSSEEIVAFMEQINKQFTIAGTETAGIEAAMLQLTQAMGSGVLRGEEYNSILEQAPNIIQAIADYMEVPKGQLKDMAADGAITADIVKAAMFAAADETNAKFESMPMTFSQIWTSFQNTALMAFQPILSRMNEIANSDAFQQFVNNAITGLATVAGITLEIFDLLVGVASAVADNWSWLSPIIYGVAVALAVYYSYLLITKTIETISTGVKIALAVASYAHAAATGAEASATAAATAAQYGLNTALLACPITWIIILIITMIALFYAAVAAVNKFAGTSVSATGIICGVFAVAGAFIGNLFVTLINFVIDIFVVLWNFIAAFANFFANVFNNPVAAIAHLFFDLVDTVLSLLQSLASAIDTIFGSNLSGAVQGWRDSLGSWVDSTFEQGEEFMATLNADDMHLGRFEYGAAWDAGYSFGEGIEDTISNFDPSSLFNTNIPSASDYADLSNYAGNGLDGISDGNNVGDIAENTGSIKDSLDITEEDLKYLRDIAEQEAINRFTIAEINIDQSGMQNTVNSGQDLDGFMSDLTDSVHEAIDTMTEGVHE